MRKIGGMPWWYIRKKIIFPAILLGALIIACIVLFSLFKSKRLSYIPRANEECYGGVSIGGTSMGAESKIYTCCSAGSSGIAWPHFEEGETCADAQVSSRFDREKEAEAPVDNIAETTDSTVESTPLVKPNPDPIEINTSESMVGKRKILLLGDSELAGSFVPSTIGESIMAVCKECAFMGSKKDITGKYNMEGFPRYTTSRFVNEELNKVISGLRSSPPDIVVIHFGTNDAVADGGASFQSSMMTIMNSFKGINENIRFVVAQIPLIAQMEGTEKKIDYRYSTAIENINKTIQQLGINYGGNPNITIDDYGMLPDGKTFDGVHPGYSGQNKIASALLGAILPLLQKSL